MIGGAAQLQPDRLVRADLKVSRSKVSGGSLAMKSFTAEYEKARQDKVSPWNKLKSLLRIKPAEARPLPQAHDFAVEEGFDVGLWLSHKLKPANPATEPQLHYRLRIWFEATDNNIESAQPGG